MARFLKIRRLLICIGSAALPSLALDLGSTELGVKGYVDAGRFQVEDTSSNGEIINRMGAKWALSRELGENWQADATLHWMFWRNQYTDLGLFHIAGIKFDSDLQGYATYNNGSHHVRLGLYEFKYNPDAKNLGEYLLRSEAYPTIVESSQGKDLLAPAFSRVMGVEYGWETEHLRLTGLVYGEQNTSPVNDLNLVAMGAFGPKDLELAAGVAWHRFAQLGDTMKSNLVSENLKQYIANQGLKAEAFKLMMRGRYAHESGFKLFAEVALLGTKSDTLFYKNMNERLPMMIGVEVPTADFLNTLSLEVEYFKNPYYERKYPRKDVTGGNYSVLPFVDDYDPAKLPNQTKDDVRWSIYLHRALNNWIDFKIRLASDHLRLLNWDGDYEGGTPLTKRTGDFYVLARIEFHN